MHPAAAEGGGPTAHLVDSWPGRWTPPRPKAAARPAHLVGSSPGRCIPPRPKAAARLPTWSTRGPGDGSRRGRRRRPDQPTW